MSKHFSDQEVLELMYGEGFTAAGTGIVRNASSPLGYCIGAMPYYKDEASDLSKPGEPHGLIAPFARRNYYRETVNRLKKIILIIREAVGRGKKDFSIFCNSRLPEKPMALQAGIGAYGKNSLILTKETGSLCILGGFLFPLDAINITAKDREKPAIPEKFALCGSCTACMDACPAGAIISPGIIDTRRCLQSLSTSMEILSITTKNIWGSKLYGCQICQDVCPRNTYPKQGIETALGEIGPSLPLMLFFEKTHEEIRKYFKGTVLDQKWIPPEALLRNAIIAAGNSRNACIVNQIEKQKTNPEKTIRNAAQWAFRQICP